ncbi:hypothetical protein BU24DRAFT_2599 [Aaosphaeria arxii CBS 175.79]|uniref:Uncharacterized protein n=1 Tax=Aaosphaeria arxii CBS 175.79 TaxID=1450172 RepID=A0A6A5Y4M9_9PLEO|nr:uncharacterized protein BU24DRAFT_2599 [Aaosphaeria arxii CBS 175.79]KAF2020535.1 hypothetical protein BU24DRAFT_2599 [Aaosphaeria arxii CBS 175.79]
MNVCAIALLIMSITLVIIILLPFFIVFYGITNGTRYLPISVAERYKKIGGRGKVKQGICARVSCEERERESVCVWPTSPRLSLPYSSSFLLLLLLLLLDPALVPAFKPPLPLPAQPSLLFPFPPSKDTPLPLTLHHPLRQSRLSYSNPTPTSLYLTSPFSLTFLSLDFRLSSVYHLLQRLITTPCFAACQPLVCGLQDAFYD